MHGQALMQEHSLQGVISFFQENNLSLTMGDLLGLTREDMVEFFGKFKGPLFYNRVAKLKAQLNELENFAPAPAPTPTPVSTPAPAPVALVDDWATPSPAPPSNSVSDQWNQSEPVQSDSSPIVNTSDAFSDARVFAPHCLAAPDPYGLRESTKRDGRANCFQWGRSKSCIRGSDCKFYHEGVETKAQSYNYDAALWVNKKGPCNAFASGTCTRGAACIFSHDPTCKPVRCGDFFKNGSCSRTPCRFSHDPDSVPAPRREGGGNECFAFAKGNCAKGADCIFAHPGVHEGKPRGPREPRGDGLFFVFLFFFFFVSFLFFFSMVYSAPHRKTPLTTNYDLAGSSFLFHYI